VSGIPIGRRRFLNILGWFASLGTFTGISWASVRYMIPNILYEPPKAFKIGRPKDYPEGVNFIPEKRIFVVRKGDVYKVISAVCTHMGCTPRWVAEQKVWECPCHGSIFDDKGAVVHGPAPDPLPWYETRIATDGRLYVDERRVVPYTQTLKVNT
jgi:cytochrome b6-f complex iron-sulfur subunit